MLDAKVYTIEITFTPTVLNSVTFQGLPSYSIFISTYQHVEFWILTSLRDFLLTHVFLPYCVIVSCSELISHFAFLLHVDEDDSFIRKQHVRNFVSISLITNIDAIRTSLTALVSHVWDHLL